MVGAMGRSCAVVHAGRYVVGLRGKAWKRRVWLGFFFNGWGEVCVGGFRGWFWVGRPEWWSRSGWPLRRVGCLFKYLWVVRILDPSFNSHLVISWDNATHDSAFGQSLLNALDLFNKGSEFSVMLPLLFLEILQDARDAGILLPHVLQFEVGRSILVDVSNNPCIT